MKKSTLSALVSYLNGEAITNLDEIRAELEKELNKGAEKAAANRALYDAAKEVVLANLSETPVTISELYEQISDELPDGFSRSKLQYGMRLWGDEITKHDTSPATYSAKE